jgi:hypothetical protein
MSGIESRGVATASTDPWPCKGWVGPAFPEAVCPIHIDGDPLPLSDVAIERITWLLSHGVALRLLATEQQWLDRFCAAVEALSDAPPNEKAN